MTATLQNVSLNVGDNLNMSVGPVIDLSTGNYSNLSGALSATWALATSSTAGATGVLLTKTLASGAITITSQSNYLGSGQTAWFVNINLVPADTVSLTPNPLNPPGQTYYHELNLTDSSGNISTLTTGNFTLLQSVINQ